jgi:hypothetical protein
MSEINMRTLHNEHNKWLENCKCKKKFNITSKKKKLQHFISCWIERPSATKLKANISQHELKDEN